MMRIECLSSVDQWNALEPGWNALLHGAAFPSVFLSWEWLSNWWRVYGAGCELRVLVARDGGRIRGIAPLMIETNGNRSRRLLLIGQTSDTLAEYLDFIVSAGDEYEVTPALCRYLNQELRGDWEQVLFERVPQTSRNLAMFHGAFQQAGFRVAERNRDVAPFLTLPGTWEQLAASKSRNFRDQLRSGQNRLARLGEVRFLLAGNGIALEDAFAHLMRLNRLRWGEAGASFRSDRYLRFHRAFAADLLQAGCLCLAVLEVAGEVAAVRYDFLFARKVWCMQGGWDPSLHACHPGTVITARVIQWAIQSGAREYDFLGGDSGYKRRWANGERSMVDFLACEGGEL